MEIVIPFIALMIPFFAIAAPFIFVLLIIWMMKGRKAQAGLSTDEARQLDQIWKRLERLETRIVNLETIMMGQPQRPAASSARH